MRVVSVLSNLNPEGKVVDDLKKCFGRCVGVKSYRCCNSYLRDMVAKEKKKAQDFLLLQPSMKTMNNGKQQQMNQNK